MEQSSPAPEQPVAPQPPVVPTPPAPATPGKSNGLAIAALVLGIIAFLFGWLGLFNLLVATLAVVFGIIALVKHQHKGFALTGTILGGLGLLTSLIVAVIFGAALLSGASHSSSSSSSSSSADATTTQDERLTLDDDWTVDTSNPYMTKVVGYVSNNSDKAISGYIQITFSALDANGANVGDCLANANTVDAHGKWKFEAMCSGSGIDSVRFKEISGF